MLIKVVTNFGDIHIIEGADSVSVKADTVLYSPYETTESHITDYFFEHVEGNDWMYSVKEISFTKGGAHCRLYTGATAYICNNDGKTVQKVEMLGAEFYRDEVKMVTPNQHTHDTLKPRIFPEKMSK